MTDSDIPEPHFTEEHLPEPHKVYEIRVKPPDDRPRFWTGDEFSPKQEEVKQFGTQAEAEEVRAGLRAGAYVISVGL